MPQIRPITDLRNNFADISKTIHASSEPIFFTKNGYGDMVVMSMEAYERLTAQQDILEKLIEAEAQAAKTDIRYTHDEVFSELRAELSGFSAEDADE